MIWIVEMLNTSYKTRSPRWEPTVGAALGRTDANKKLAEWRKANPDDKFRITLYRPCK